MTETFELTLNNPLTEEQWDQIADVDMDRTDSVTFHTKHGKEVEFKKVRHGMWLPKHHYIAGHEFVSGHICSECGDDALNAEGDEFLTDYCPWCGARMDEE